MVLRRTSPVDYSKISAQMRWRIDARDVRALKDAWSDRAGFRNLADEWAAAYFAFLQRRFRTNSLGGGGWKKLSKRAQRTKKWARWGRKAILADGLQLYNALTPERNVIAPGQLRTIRTPGPRGGGARNAVFLGLGGPDIHLRKSNSGERRTIAQIATIHQYGFGRNPKREIVIPPPAHLVKWRLEAITRKWNDRILRRTGMEA